jgi:hypothetical protein
MNFDYSCRAYADGVAYRFPETNRTGETTGFKHLTGMARSGSWRD